MKASVVDAKKHIAGWIIIGLAIAAAVLCVVRDAAQNLLGCAFVALMGWTFVVEAKKNPQTVPRKPIGRFHWMLIAALFAVGILLGYFATRL